MKKILSKIMSLCLVFAVIAMPSTAAYAAAEKSAGNSWKIMSMSDTHLLIRKMIKNTTAYKRDINIDNKLYTESEAAVDRQLQLVRQEKPNILLITGDLTKDGELENHKAMSSKLRALKRDMPNMKIYVIDGNHDIRNSNGKNFNTKNGKPVPAETTSPKQFASLYDVTYKDSTVVSRYKPAEGTEAGMLSYAARPYKGLTIIALDSCCYSKDSNSDGEEEHETRGNIPAGLEKWAIKQIKAAKKRGDLVIGMEHHNIIPHFTMEEDVMAAFLVDNWDEASTAFADAGLNYIFTGHMHATDVSRRVTAKGNELFDIETGSSITYPCPTRITTFTRSKSGNTVTETAKGKTVEDLSVSFKSPLTGKNTTVPNLTELGYEHLVTEDLASGIVKSLLWKNLDDVPQSVYDAIDKIVWDLCRIPVTKDKKYDAREFVKFAYARTLAGDDDSNLPAWYKEGRKYVASGAFLDKALRVLVKDLIAASVETQRAILSKAPVIDKLLSAAGIDPTSVELAVRNAVATKSLSALGSINKSTVKHISAYLVKLTDSFAVDTNYDHDQTFSITEKWSTKTGLAIKKKKQDNSCTQNPEGNSGYVDNIVAAVL